MKVALLLPGYLDSPDYLHLVTFEKRLKELGYVVERLDLGDLWETGNPKNYTVTYFIDQVKRRVGYYKSQNPEEILLLGHSRGAFTAIIAGSRIEEVTKIIALCPPPDIKASVRKWLNRGERTSKRDLSSRPTEYRKFSIPYVYVEDSMKYSAVEEVKNLHKPLMIFIALNDEVVPPELTEQIVANANNPHVVRQSNMGHDFRRSQEECDIVMNEIEKFLGRLNIGINQIHKIQP